MALRRTFREMAYRPARRDRAFRKALLTEAVHAYPGGDQATGNAVLRDVINATVGFEPLAAELRKPAKSLHRTLGPGGNPGTANFFAVLQVLQKRAGVKLTLKAAQDPRPPVRCECCSICAREMCGFSTTALNCCSALPVTVRTADVLGFMPGRLVPQVRVAVLASFIAS